MVISANSKYMYFVDWKIYLIKLFKMFEKNLVQT